MLRRVRHKRKMAAAKLKEEAARIEAESPQCEYVEFEEVYDDAHVDIANCMG